MAKKVFKIAIPGYNAFEDDDPDHFALYVDQQVDYILIKQKEEDTVSVANGGTENIVHNLGYVPFCLVFVEISSGIWRKLHSSPIDGVGVWFEVNTTNLILRNTSGSSKNFSYRIFYDNVTN